MADLSAVIEDLVAANRILAMEGVVDSFGHVSVRHPERPRLELEVRNESKRVVLVSSHFPFHEVNQRLVFDRAAANGYRLDLPSGEVERWEPGETRDVTDAEEVAALAGSPLFEVASSGKASKSTASPVTETAEAAPAAEATSN